MPEIINTTGKSVTKSGLVKVTKGFEGLLITSDLQFSALTTEEIKISIQRINEDNVEVTKGFMKLRDFILMSTYGEAAIACDVDGKMSVLCDLTFGGNIHLLEKEEIFIELQGLKTANGWIVDTIETFEVTSDIMTFEQKTMATEQKNQTFPCDLAHLVVLDNSADITDVRLQFANGQRITYTLRELRGMARQADPVALIDSTGAIKTGFTDKIQLALLGVLSLEINKADTSSVKMFFRGGSRL